MLVPWYWARHPLKLASKDTPRASEDLILLEIQLMSYCRAVVLEWHILKHHREDGQCSPRDVDSANAWTAVGTASPPAVGV